VTDEVAERTDVIVHFFGDASVLRTSREIRCRSVLLNRSMWFVLRAYLVIALCCVAVIIAQKRLQHA